MEPDPLREFLDVMRELRAGCSWKAEQTHRSLVRYLLEETHETIEAIEAGSADDLCEELGDLLLQVYFHAVIAEETGAFTLDDVARGVIAKMHRRNPHVFGEAVGGSPDEVDAAWQRIKAAEKARSDPLDGLPASLPALLWAGKVLSRKPELTDLPSAELTDLHGGTSQEIGERLLALVVEAREAGVDAEQALRDAVRARL